MKRIVVKYRAGSVFFVGFLVLGTAVQAQESKDKASQSPTQQAQTPGLEPGPGPTSSRPDTTGTPGTMSSRSKSAKQQMKECIAHTRASNTAVSESDAKKTCQQAMKAQKESPPQEKPK